HHAGAGSGRADETLVHRGGGVHVQTARWILGDDQLRRTIELAREHELLLIAARQGPRGGAGCPAPHIEFARQLRRTLALLAPRNSAAPRAGVLESQVLGDRELG